MIGFSRFQYNGGFLHTDTYTDTLVQWCDIFIINYDLIADGNVVYHFKFPIAGFEAQLQFYDTLLFYLA